MNPNSKQRISIDTSEIDRKIIAATQKGLPLVQEPYEAIANQVGIDNKELMSHITDMLKNGTIRRVGIIPNHHRLGYVENGLSVWDIDDDVIDEMGERIGALDYISHCYKRPRHRPLWPYNLFAMVHAKTRKEVEEKVAAIATIVAGVAHAHDIIYSTEVLKKTGYGLCGPKKKTKGI